MTRKSVRYRSLYDKIGQSQSKIKKNYFLILGE